MTKKEIINSLIKQAHNHKKTAEDLFTMKHYDWCLFLWHLALEKLLKAKILASGKHIIYTHNIERLYKLTELPADNKIKDQLKTITSFNLEARYDNYKFDFYKKATRDYAKKWVEICTTIVNSIQNDI